MTRNQNGPPNPRRKGTGLKPPITPLRDLREKIGRLTCIMKWRSGSLSKFCFVNSSELKRAVVAARRTWSFISSFFIPWTMAVKILLLSLAMASESMSCIYKKKIVKWSCFGGRPLLIFS